MSHGIETVRADDGRFIHTFRQSTISELDLCPERGRATMAGEMPDVLKDATCMGTAVHAGIEGATRMLHSAEGPAQLDELTNVALGTFQLMAREPNFAWVKYTPAKAMQLIRDACELFYDELYHTLKPLLIEKHFGPILLYEDDKRLVMIEGQIDLFDEDVGAVDYKTAGDSRKYARGRGGEAWKLDRWAIQPTLYCAALRRMGYYSGKGPWPFTYLVFDFGGKDVTLLKPDVKRRHEDVEWAKRKMVSYCHLIEAGVPVWPMQDNHALCSDKWCDLWSTCKGAHYADVEWPLRGQ